MALVVLIQAQPRNPSTGAVVPVRLAGGGSKAYSHLGFNDWRSCGARPARVASSLGFDQAGFTGGALPKTAGIRIGGSDKALFTMLGNLNWIGAPITVTHADDELAAPVYTVALNGIVASAATAGAILTLTLADLSAILDKPVAPDTFSGLGGIEGGSDAAGRVKRRSWGYVFNVEGRVLDKANNIYEFGDPARQLQQFVAVKDKGYATQTYVGVGWQGSIADTLTALRNTVVPSGGCAVAPSIACVKWWTVPVGPLTADLRGEVGAGYAETVCEIAARVVGIYAPTITMPNLSAAVSWQQNSAGVHVADANETAAGLLDRLLIPVSIAWRLTGAGALLFSRIAWTASTATVRADTIAREATYSPLLSRTVGYQRNYREHSDAEISAAFAGEDILYADGTTGAQLRDSLARILSDGVISRGGEKATLIQLYNLAVTDYQAKTNSSIALNTTYGGDPTNSQRSAAFSAYNALTTFLNGLSPAYNDVNSDTPAPQSILRDLFSNLDFSTKALDAANAAYVAMRAQQAKPRKAQELVSASNPYPITSTSSSISIAAFTGRTDTGNDYNFPAMTINGLQAGTTYKVFYYPPNNNYGARVVGDPQFADYSGNPDFVALDWQSTPNAGGGYVEPYTPPPGYGGGGRRPNEQIP